MEYVNLHHIILELNDKKDIWYNSEIIKIYYKIIKKEKENWKR